MEKAIGLLEKALGLLERASRKRYNCWKEFGKSIGIAGDSVGIVKKGVEKVMGLLEKTLQLLERAWSRHGD